MLENQLVKTMYDDSIATRIHGAMLKHENLRSSRCLWKGFFSMNGSSSSMASSSGKFVPLRHVPFSHHTFALQMASGEQT